MDRPEDDYSIPEDPPSPEPSDMDRPPVRKSDLIWEDLDLDPLQFRQRILSDCRILTMFCEQAQMRLIRYTETFY